MVTVVRVGAGGGDGVNRVDGLPARWIGGRDWWARDLGELHLSRLMLKLWFILFL